MPVSKSLINFTYLEPSHEYWGSNGNVNNYIAAWLLKEDIFKSNRRYLENDKDNIRYLARVVVTQHMYTIGVNFASTIFI